MTAKEQFLILTNTQKLQKANAVVLLEGDGFTRIHKACSIVIQGWADILVFSGGVENESYGSFPFGKCYDLILAAGVKHEQIIHEAKSKHTRQQAEEVITICKEKGWKKIILVATHYHQYRAFLTFLKVLEEKKIEHSIHIINAPANTDWFQKMPWGKRIELLDNEFERIEKYKTLGHVSTYENAIKYYEQMEIN